MSCEVQSAHTIHRVFTAAARLSRAPPTEWWYSEGRSQQPTLIGWLTFYYSIFFFWHRSKEWVPAIRPFLKSFQLLVEMLRWLLRTQFSSAGTWKLKGTYWKCRKEVQITFITAARSVQGTEPVAALKRLPIYPDPLRPQSTPTSTFPTIRSDASSWNPWANFLLMWL